jgi:hypothetical protein
VLVELLPPSEAAETKLAQAMRVLLA